MSIIEFPKKQPEMPVTRGIQTMFAIAYDFDGKKLEENYHSKSWRNAYTDFKRFMEKKGFSTQQESILYGNDDVSMTDAYIAITEASREFAWLKDSITDIRILQLMNNDDLMPFVEMGHTMIIENKKAS